MDVMEFLLIAKNSFFKIIWISVSSFHPSPQSKWIRISLPQAPSLSITVEPIKLDSSSPSALGLFFFLYHGELLSVVVTLQNVTAETCLWTILASIEC